MDDCYFPCRTQNLQIQRGIDSLHKFKIQETTYMPLVEKEFRQLH